MYFNPLFALLKDGRQMVVYSDNDHEGTMTVFPVDELPYFDAEYAMFNTIPATDVIRTGRDRPIVFAEDHHPVKN